MSARTTFSKLVWQEAVRRCKNIPAAQRLVILHIGATADPHGRNAWRANNLVSDELAVSRDTVKRARKAAIDHGRMVVTRPAPRGAGNTKTAEYQLILPAAAPVVDDLENGGSAAPISADQLGAADSTNSCKTAPEIGAAEGHPSVLSSGSSSGEKRAREKSFGVEGGLASDPGNELAPATLSANRSEPATNWVMGPFGPRCHRHENDRVPPRCGGCRDARDGAKAQAEAERTATAAEKRAVRAEIDACTFCDHNGMTHGDEPRRCTGHRQLSDAGRAS